KKEAEVMVLNIAIVVVALSIIPSAYRMLIGPTRADRVSAADALLFVLVRSEERRVGNEFGGMCLGCVLIIIRYCIFYCVIISFCLYFVILFFFLKQKTEYEFET